MTNQITVRLVNGETFGPIDREGLMAWVREGRIPMDAMLESSDGTPSVRASDDPEIQAYLNAPPVRPVPVGHAPPPDSGVTTLIPYRNGCALAGYYTSIGSLVPVVGLALGPIAFILGILGFRQYRRTPEVKGAVHAWIAILLGGLTALVNYGFIVLILMAP